MVFESRGFWKHTIENDIFLPEKCRFPEEEAIPALSLLRLKSSQIFCRNIDINLFQSNKTSQAQDKQDTDLEMTPAAEWRQGGRRSVGGPVTVW